jgi:subtilisin family serine protease/subtilisin-like proprotein convertase family protein
MMTATVLQTGRTRFRLDSSETLDTDSDGVGNNADDDDDGDGVADGSDDYPLNPDVHQAPTTAAQSLYLNLLPQTTNGGTGTLTSTSQDSRRVAYSIVSNGSLGTATITDSSTGAFSYSTTSTVSGNDTFTYKVNDGYVDSTASTISLELRTDPLYKYQWHLDNTGQKNFASNGGTTGADINVDTVIAGGNTGSDIVVAIVDDGIEIAHEDLSGNVVSGGSWNYADSSTDPTPVNSTDNHGTAVAGIVASVGWNQIGGRGVAPNAKLKGFNILADPDGDGVRQYSGIVNEANALGGGASSLFSDISIYNMSYGGPDTSLTPPSTSTIQGQLAEGVSSGRGAKGAIYVASAGNDFYKGAQSSGDYSYCGDGGNRGGMKVACYDAVFDHRKGLPYVITVGALNADGVKSSYSTPGAVTWVSAPGGEYGRNSNYASGYPGEPAIMTTDLSGCSSGTSRSGTVDYNSFNDGDFPVSENSNCDYLSTMNGTSSAAPMVSGVVALMLEANANLGWRDVKHILASTASQVDSSFSADAISTVDYVQWITNSAGYKFHPWYGFGAVDAQAAVNAAATHTNLSSSAFTSWNNANSESTAISDLSLFSRTISESTSGTVEWVRVALLIDHSSPNHLGFRLESPSGTVSTLLPPVTALSTSLSSATWVYLPSNAFYGESMQGEWKIYILDHIHGTTGTFARWGLQFLYR